MTDSRGFPSPSLIEDLRRRAQLMCDGEVMDLRCSQRAAFIAETGAALQALLREFTAVDADAERTV